MSLALLLTAALIGPQASPPSDFWREEFMAVMSATTDRAKLASEIAVPRLVSLYVHLENVELPRTERVRMRRSLEGRLVKRLEILLREKRKVDRPIQRAAGKSLAGGGATAVAAQQLIDLIVTTIDPESWKQNGGNGSISFYPNNPALIIRQTSQGHEEISQLLRALNP